VRAVAESLFYFRRQVVGNDKGAEGNKHTNKLKPENAILSALKTAQNFPNAKNLL
jgi:hypothetical protein